MALPGNSEYCEVLFHDGTFWGRDLIGMAPCEFYALLCLDCGKVWVPSGPLDIPQGTVAALCWFAFKVIKGLVSAGAECPFCRGGNSFPYSSPRVTQALREKRREWFAGHPVRWDAKTPYDFGFRSGYVTRTLGEFLGYATDDWGAASWHFAESHMEDWLRSVGRKDLATMMGSSKGIQGSGREGFEHWRSRLKEYGAL